MYQAFANGNDGVVQFVRERLARRRKATNVAAQLVRHARKLEESVVAGRKRHVISAFLSCCFHRHFTDGSHITSKIDDMSAVVVELRPFGDEEDNNPSIISEEDSHLPWINPPPSYALATSLRLFASKHLWQVVSVHTPALMCFH